MTMRVAMIWAQARGGVIGKDGTMPWHLPEDLAHFKAETLGGPVIMGRRTWESLHERFRPLPGRENIVVSRTLGFHAEGATVVSTLERAVELARATGAHTGWIMGGGQLYRDAMPHADELVVTQIDLEVEGADTFAPEIGAEWVLTERGDVQTAANGVRYHFERYERRAMQSQVVA